MTMTTTAEYIASLCFRNFHQMSFHWEATMIWASCSWNSSASGGLASGAGASGTTGGMEVAEVV